MTGKFDAQQEVTDRIIAAIEAGTPPWRKPWTGDRGGAAFPLRAWGEPYRGINVILCTHLGLTPDFEQSGAYKSLSEKRRREG